MSENNAALAITDTEEQVKETETLTLVETPAETPAVESGEGVWVKGEFCTPKTHAWRDGAPILRKDGSAKKKPGRTGPLKQEDADATSTTEATEATDSTEKAVEAPAKTESVKTATVAPATKKVVKEKPVADTTSTPTVTSKNLPVKATVQTTFGKNATSEATDETIEVRTFLAPPANIEIGYGLTLNIGNYESARVDVKLSVPCYKEEVDAAYSWAKQWAESRVQKEVADVRKLALTKPPSSPF